ncbi:MarR family transcriptional regulator [Zhengella mangrovi]|uniref:MarR family transcriptional regulator n=1 Tax=Zhengella mangrovi TaxID=1982044 RepID=A0A2G1QQ99_9HYPH|nr:MarR family winged helix-turn-helix transcriptional regulator [Zhengella mangrovi]PHP67672.1 MarR family transcriptional regulator [Zhengella mangrovi]
MSQEAIREKRDAARAEDVVPPLDTIIGYKLRRAQLAVFQDFAESFARMKLRPAEFSALALIARQPGSKQSEIAEALGVKPANLVALMDGLEKRGLAERRKTDTDRRSYSLYLTAKGEKFVLSMASVWRDHENRMIERLGGEGESRRFIEMLEKVAG